MPTCQSECDRPERRGLVITLSGPLIASEIHDRGQIPYWTNYGFYFLEGSIRWRFPTAFRSFFTILVMIGLFILPDSPRWLTFRGRMAETHDIPERLRGKDLDDAEVELGLQNIKELREVQDLGNGFRMIELLSNGPSQNLRRTLLEVAGQFFQQQVFSFFFVPPTLTRRFGKFTGINLVTYCKTFVFETSLGFDPGMSRLLAAANGMEYFIAALCSLPSPSDSAVASSYSAVPSEWQPAWRLFFGVYFIFPEPKGRNSVGL